MAWEPITAPVIVVGGGSAAAEASPTLGQSASVTPIAQENFLLFAPMLAEIASVHIEPRDILAPLRRLCPRARMVIGEVLATDAAARTATVRPGVGCERPVRHRPDALVLTAGSAPAGFGVPGVRE